MRKRKRIVAYVLTFGLLISTLSTTSFGVTGNTIAADGTYTYKYDGYSFSLKVSSGKVASLTSSGLKSSYQSLLTAYQKNLVGTTASYNAIDAVSAGTTKKSYGPGLKSATLKAIQGAAAATGQSVTNYTVTFQMNGHGSQIASQTVSSGSTAAKPANPTASGYSFDGWYSDSTLTKSYNFSTAVTGNLTLYAKWTENSSSPGTNPSGVYATGLYFDDTVEVKEYGYGLSVTLTVNEDGKIVGVTADSTGVSKKNARRLKAAIEGIRNQILWQDATQSTLQGIDAISGATYSSMDIKEALLKAVAKGPLRTSTEMIESAGASTTVVADGTYVNSSGTTYEEVYNPVIMVTVSGGKITEITATAPGIRSYSAQMLAAARDKVQSDLKGKEATQANVDKYVDVDSVSGATHSMKVIKEDIYNAFAQGSITTFETDSTAAGRMIYNPPPAVSENGLTLQKSLTEEADGTYTITLTANATQESSGSSGSEIEYYEESPKTEFSIYDLDGKTYFYYRNGHMYPVSWTTHQEKEGTLYCGYITIDGIRYYIKQKNIETQVGEDTGNVNPYLAYETKNGSFYPLYIRATGNHTSDYQNTVTSYSPGGSGIEYSYNNLRGGSYYFKYKGNYYQIQVENNKNANGSDYRYAAYFVVGSTKFWLKKDKSDPPYTTSRTDSDVGRKDTDKDLYESTSSYPLYTLTSTSATVKVVGAYPADGGSGGMYIGAGAVITDEINLNTFDVSNARYSIKEGKVTKVSGQKVPSAQSDDAGVMIPSALISYTGFDYSANYIASDHEGKALTLTITGLTLAEGAAGEYLSSDIGNAEIYVSGTAKYPEVAAVSPLLDYKTNQHLLKFDLNGGTDEYGDYADYTGDSYYAYAGAKIYFPDDFPVRSDDVEFREWQFTPVCALKTDANGNDYFIMPDSDETVKALWNEPEPPDPEPVPDASKYIDETTPVTDFGYTPFVIVTVNDSGAIENLTATGAPSRSNRFLQQAVTAILDLIKGQPATDATVNAIPDVISGATAAGVTLKESLGKALKAKNTITFVSEGQTVDQAKYTTGTVPRYLGDPLPDTFVAWSPELAAANGDATYTAQYPSTGSRYDLNVEDITIQYNSADPESSTASGAKDFYWDEWGGVGSYYLLPDIRFLMDEKTYNLGTASKYYIVWEVEDLSILGIMDQGDNWLVPTGKSGMTTVHLNVKRAAGSARDYENDEAVLTKAFTVTALRNDPLPDGVYGDHSETTVVSNHTAGTLSYKPIVALTVQDGKITDLHTDGNCGSRSKGCMEDVEDWLKALLVGQTADVSVISDLLDSADTDAVSGATTSRISLTAEVRKALEAGKKHDLDAGYTVTWLSTGTEYDKDTNVTYGTRVSVIQPSDPSDAGFTGWNIPEEDFFVTGDRTYEASWKAMPADVTIDPAGGTITANPDVNADGSLTGEKKAGDTIQLPDAQKQGYTLTSWKDPENKVHKPGEIYEIPDGSVTLTAVWEANPADVMIDPAGGTITANSDVNADGTLADGKKVGDKILLPNAEKAGYTLAGWEDENGSILQPGTEYTVPLSTGTLTAKWDLMEYGITYQLDGGQMEDGAVNPETCTVADPEIRLNNPIREGYVFAGWTGTDLTEPTVEVTIPAGSTGDRSYTAHWIVRDYQVTWINGDGSILKTESVAYSATPEYTGITPTKTDPDGKYTYTFNGTWDSVTDPETGDVVYTAQFDAVQTGYHIYVKDYTNGGAVTSLDPETYYSEMVTFSVTAGQAVVVADFTDGTVETMDSQEGSYERLYCTEADGSHRFSVRMPGDRDVILVMGYKGDYDCNGTVTLKDATRISQVYVETQTANALQILLGDFDGNGSLALKDATRITQFYTGTDGSDWDLM